MDSTVRTPGVCITIIMSSWIVLATAEVYTSSFKVHTMVMEEERVLAKLKSYIDSQNERLKLLTNFYTERHREVSLRQNADHDIKHPNAVYNIIKKYASIYSPILNDKEENFSVVLEQSGDTFMADNSDVRGAIESLLRLQDVYSLKANDMAKGDYLGYEGPEMEPVDAYEIGKIAFSKGQLNASIDWLNTSLTLGRASMVDNAAPSKGTISLGAVLGLMGRVYVRAGNIDVATDLFVRAKQLAPAHGDVVTLEQELTSPLNTSPPPSTDMVAYARLCSLENRIYPAEPTSPWSMCRYRPALLPYYTFQEEILSVNPFSSVIYNVITDQEAEHMKGHVQGKLKRGRIRGINPVVSDVRTTNTAWIKDMESPVVAEVSKRIEHITGLETDQRLPDGPSSSESLQIANYGLGGHYSVHMDALETQTDVKELMQAGNRIATFLIYLSDVERGGATVFPRTGVSVAPVKNMALFWYNFDTALEKDEKTLHAGCPVMIGQKWIANKWIWTFGNTFRRRCGLTPNATQLQIEADMRRDYAPF